MQRSYRSKAGQEGEAEAALFITVVVICCLISAALWLFGWFRETKDGRVERRMAARIEQTARKTPAPFASTIDAGEYYVTCQRSIFDIFKADTPCEILPESYRELSMQR